LLYFKHPTALSIIIISGKRSSSKGSRGILVSSKKIIIQAIVVQEQSTGVKALDFYYKDRSKLDSFLISINIYILFNTYLFGTEAAKVVYTISYLRRISFN
jgi:hypothetical protein